MPAPSTQSLSSVRAPLFKAKNPGHRRGEIKDFDWSQAAVNRQSVQNGQFIGEKQNKQVLCTSTISAQ
jgi:hypothetical protein